MGFSRAILLPILDPYQWVTRLEGCGSPRVVLFCLPVHPLWQVTHRYLSDCSSEKPALFSSRTSFQVHIVTDVPHRRWSSFEVWEGLTFCTCDYLTTVLRNP
jgi:hypothetical protein